MAAEPARSTPAAPQPGRRRFLGAGLAGLAACGLAGAKLWPEDGWTNPCLAALPPALAQHDLLQAAWSGLDPSRVWDMHCHIAGNGDRGSGIAVHADMYSHAHPFQLAQRLFYMDAACAAGGSSIDAAYVERLEALIEAFPPGARAVLLAFDAFHDADGRARREQSTFIVPNDYAHRLAAARPQRFAWAASIHPYRADCVEAVASAAARGAVLIKWLPAAQGMDPASPACDRFYEAAARHDLPLLVHCGAERAVQGGDTQNFGTPLRLRRALEHGMRVIVAHCASLGSDRDTERGGAEVASFDLFARLMQDARYEGKLFGDISAVTQFNRCAEVLPQLLQRREWHGRLLNGSDYPLPGVMPLVSLRQLESLGMLPAAALPVLSQLRAHNALLFDFVLKRTLALDGQRFSAAAFETARLLAPRRHAHLSAPTPTT
ncbi:MAG: amidohydrolase family protein [Rhodocyclaceae bacterium]|nr:amidohydrolase family protein [Rhodocyclaceae bacterium]